MYDVVILNFGDGARAFYDASRQPVFVEVGAMKDCTLDDATAKVLFEGQRSDTICIMRQHVELPGKLRQMFSLLKRVLTDPYEEVLSEATAMVGITRFDSLRPNREQIREVLGRVARSMCAEFAPAIDVAPRAIVKDDASDDLTDAELIGDDHGEDQDDDQDETGDADDADEDAAPAKPKVARAKIVAKAETPTKSKAKAKKPVKRPAKRRR